MSKSNLTIIIVEGVSDVAFLSLYISKVYGFKFASSNNTHKHYVCKYTRSGASSDGLLEKRFEDTLYIISADGHDKMSRTFEEFATPIMGSKLPEGGFIRLIFLTDADEGEKKVKLPKSLSYLDKDAFLDDENSNVMESPVWSGREVLYKAYCSYVPCEGEGCLETLLMEAMSATDEKLIEESKTFVDGLSDEAGKYLGHARLRLKAKIGVAFSLLKPDSTFMELNEKFELINCDDPAIREQFDFLSFLK